MHSPYYSRDYRKHWLGWLELPPWKEGHSGNSVDYQTFMFNHVKRQQPLRILEIGFNAGHSACCFLNASPKAKMVTFDICRWGMEVEALAVLQKYFDIDLIEGDSSQTVPRYLSDHAAGFDFIFVDGNHSGDAPYIDLVNVMGALNFGGYLLVDNMEEDDVRAAVGRIDWAGYHAEVDGQHRPDNPAAPFNHNPSKAPQRYLLIQKQHEANSR